MATENQHFVPRVYLKAWETKVETKKEPQKQFDGVYYFEKGDTVGEGATRETILWEPHLYTNIVEFGGINDWPGETVSGNG